jgi:GNAT superfamily N-acetyltransferase
MIRRFREDDESSVDALLRASWPEDPVLCEISAIHGLDIDADDGWRRTLVYEEAAAVIGAGSVFRSARHPTRLFVVVVVAPDRRRTGVGSNLMRELRRLTDSRELLARAREHDEAAIGFCRKHGFGLLMKSRTGVVDPSVAGACGWVSGQRALVVDDAAPRDELARAHEAAYRAEHASWSPTTERPLDESLHLFCGESWLPQSGLAVRAGDRIVAVAGLHGPPMAPSHTELFLIAGSANRDAQALRAVVAAELALARSLGAHVSIEADQANAELWTILTELPAILEPDLLLLSTDAATPLLPSSAL